MFHTIRFIRFYLSYQDKNLFERRTFAIKKTVLSAIAITLVLSLILSLCSCFKRENQTQESVQITISDEIPYSNETIAYSNEVLLSLLKYGYQKSVMTHISASSERKLTEIANDLCAIMAKTPISESIYKEFWKTLSIKGAAAIDEITLLRSENDNCNFSMSNTKELYASLSLLVGNDYVGGILYEVCKYFYDYSYKTKMADFEKYHYPHLLEAAEKINSDRAVFASISKDSFSDVISWGLIMSELFSKDALNSESLKAFTDEEIIIFIDALEFEAINISNDAWKLILNNVIPSFDDSLPYHIKLLAVAKECNDTEKISKTMSSMSAICASILKGLDSKDILALREGKTEDVISRAFEKFGDSEWQYMEDIDALELSLDAYTSVVEAEHGKGYESYLDQIEKPSLGELKEFLGKDSFYTVLINYFAGVCPMLFYGE